MKGNKTTHKPNNKNKNTINNKITLEININVIKKESKIKIKNTK